jgi:hypothetical protein
MPTSPPPLKTCPACGTPIETAGDCPQCAAALDKQEPIEASDFTLRRFEEWFKAGRLTDRQWQAIAEQLTRQRQHSGSPGVSLPPRTRCWSCKESVTGAASHCEACGAPVGNPAVKSLRFCRFLVRQIDTLEQGRWLTLRQAHEFDAETQDRIRALKRKLEQDRAPMLIPVQAEAAAVRPRRAMMEVLLDPHSIQWLLAIGGGLIVLGLVIWLSSLGLFENPGVVAACLGIGNGAILLGGWALTLRTRYQNAGRALTLLACLVMPLNLWFYHTHHLITLEGHLWLAGLVCCVIYAISAVVLRDALFVYVLVGGVTLTGLLLLGELHQVGELLYPVTMLIVLSLVCLHAERAFPPEDASPFARRRFGMAFYWCAQALLFAGLTMLLWSQLLGWLHGPLQLHQLGIAMPLAAERGYLPLTLTLVLLGTYALVYSDVVVRRIGVYLYLAAITLLWAEIQLLVLLEFADSAAIVIVTLALTALAVNIVQVQFQAKRDFLRTVPPLGVILSLIPVLFGVLLHFRATNRVLNDLWEFHITWPLVGAMLATALSCRAAAYLYRKTHPDLSAFYFFATAAATLVFAAQLVWLIGLKPWETQAPILMLIPVAYLVAAHLYRGHTPERPLAWCAHASTAIMLLCSMYVAAGVIPQVREVVPLADPTHHLLLAVFCLEAALFYGLAAALRKTEWSIYLTTVMLCGAIWQLLSFFDAPSELYPLAFSLLGLVLLIAYRLALLEQWEWTGLSRASYESANALAMLGFVAGVLLSLTRLLLPDTSLARLDAQGHWEGPLWIALYLMVFLAAAALLSAWLVQQQAWRRAYVTSAIVAAAMAGLTFHRLHPLNPWQTLEVVSVIIGLLVLIAAHVGWYRETDERSSDAVTMGLFFGSAALVLPLAIATVVNRFAFQISPIDELALVFASVALLVSGVMGRLRTTTLFGAIALVLYTLMVVIYLHRFLREQVLIGIYVTLGGVIIFGVGLALSVYRDRLLALPDKIKRREGVFRVFGWR